MANGGTDLTVVCNACSGQGRIYTEPCSGCGGAGRSAGMESLAVKIPPGVNNGGRLRIPGKGEAGPDGRTGDLFLRIHVTPHKYFRREGKNLHVDLPVNISEAALGDKVEVPTLDGKVALKIPAGTQSHKVFRMRKKGMPHVNRPGSGDQLVRVLAWTPDRLDKSLKQKLEAVQKDLAATVPAPGRHIYD